MSDFGRGRAYPLDPESNGPVEPEASLGVEPVKTMILNPDYPNLLRYFLNAMTHGSFDGVEGNRKGVHSIMDITRYLAQKDPQALQEIMQEYTND